MALCWLWDAQRRSRGDPGIQMGEMRRTPSLLLPDDFFLFKLVSDLLAPPPPKKTRSLGRELIVPRGFKGFDEACRKSLYQNLATLWGHYYVWGLLSFHIQMHYYLFF